jgi:hypothetical protein
VKDRADVLECLINGKHGDHSSHLHSYAYRHGCMAGAGALVLTVGPNGLDTRDQRERHALT